jgi:hypothetical protein
MAEPGSLNALATARRIAERLDEDGLPYGIGGALALGAWGAVRATKDVDITIFVREAELPRAFDALERAGVMIDRTSAVRDVGRIGMFKGLAGRVIVDVSAEDLCLHKLLFGRVKDSIDLERLIARNPDLDLAYVRGWLTKMVPAGDRRLALLDDLERRFAARG